MYKNWQNQEPLVLTESNPSHNLEGIRIQLFQQLAPELLLSPGGVFPAAVPGVLRPEPTLLHQKSDPRIFIVKITNSLLEMPFYVYSFFKVNISKSLLEIPLYVYSFFIVKISKSLLEIPLYAFSVSLRIIKQNMIYQDLFNFSSI